MQGSQTSGLSLRAGGRGFSLATTSPGPSNFDIKQNIGKRKMHQITKI